MSLTKSRIRDFARVSSLPLCMAVLSGGCDDSEAGMFPTVDGSASALGVACETSSDCESADTGDEYQCLEGICRESTESQPGSSEECPSDVDAALAKANIHAPDRRDCGALHVLQADEIAGSQMCLDNAIEAGTAAQWSINTCLDCLDSHTFVSTAEGQTVLVKQTGGSLSTVMTAITVESCTEIAAELEPACIGSELLYACP